VGFVSFLRADNLENLLSRAGLRFSRPLSPGLPCGFVPFPRGGRGGGNFGVVMPDTDENEFYGPTLDDIVEENARNRGVAEGFEQIRKLFERVAQLEHENVAIKSRLERLEQAK
jgi:hypothetical protein